MVGLNWIFILRNESFHLKSWCHCKQLTFSWGQWNSWGLRDRLLCLPLQKSHLFPLLDPVSIISSATTTTDSDTASIPATITAAMATAVSTVSECKEIFFSVESAFKTKVMLTITDSKLSFCLPCWYCKNARIIIQAINLFFEVFLMFSG